MNPAALKANLRDLPRGATIIANTDEFSKRNLAKVGYAESPLEDGTLESWHVHPVALTSITVEALAGFDLSRKDKERAKNMFALGLLSWMYHRPTAGTELFLTNKFGSQARHPRGQPRGAAGRPELRRDHRGLRGLLRDRARQDAGRHLPQHHRQRRPRLRARDRGPPGRPPAGARAPTRSPRPPTSCTRSSGLKRYGVTTMQAEDEIAGIGAALGASFGGAIGVTTTSGPGLALKSETIGLAVSLELPLVIVDVQRGGPSTGLPTKTEQSDLLQAMFGRNGESPVPIIAPSSPADCFDAAIEAVRIATTYRTPVLLLSDGYLANGSEPWRLPSVRDLPDLTRGVRHRAQRRRRRGPAGLPPVPARRRRRSPARGPCPARPGSSTASAASRRPTSPATSPTTPTTTT